MVDIIKKRDRTLSKKIISNTEHVLYDLLPPKMFYFLELKLKDLNEIL